MKNEAVSQGKKRMAMVNMKGGDSDYAEGSPAEEKSESPSEASSEGDTGEETTKDTGDQGGSNEEAQAIVDSIGDNHDLCMAVYELLKEKYDAEKKQDKGGGDVSEPLAMSDDGMPKD